MMGDIYIGILLYNIGCAPPPPSKNAFVTKQTSSISKYYYSSKVATSIYCRSHRMFHGAEDKVSHFMAVDSLPDVQHRVMIWSDSCTRVVTVESLSAERLQKAELFE